MMAAEDMHYCSTAKSSKQATLNQSLFSVAYMSERDAERQALAALLGDREKKAFARAIALPGGASMLSQHLSGHRPISFEAAVCYAHGLGVTVRAISPRLADLALAAIATPGDAGEPPAIASLPRAALNRPDLAAALETLGAELAADMPPDLRQDVADILSKLAMRGGLARHQTELITLLHSKPAKQSQGRVKSADVHILPATPQDTIPLQRPTQMSGPSLFRVECIRHKSLCAPRSKGCGRIGQPGCMRLLRG